MNILKRLGNFCLYLLLASGLAWFAFVCWIYLAPVNWLARQAQTGFIYQQLSAEGKSIAREITWQNLAGSLGKGKAQLLITPHAKLGEAEWQISFLSLLIAQPKFQLTAASSQLTSPLSFYLGKAQAEIQPAGYTSLFNLIQATHQAKFDWQVTFTNPAEHQLHLSGYLTPRLYSFKGKAAVAENSPLVAAMQLLNWREVTNNAAAPFDTQLNKSYQARGSGRF